MSVIVLFLLAVAAFGARESYLTWRMSDLFGANYRRGLRFTAVCYAIVCALLVAAAAVETFK